MPYPSAQYPPGSEDAEVEGVDLALADGDVATILHDYCTRQELDPDDQTMLRHVLTSLTRALPSLEGPGRSYFETALELLKAVDDST